MKDQKRSVIYQDLRNLYYYYPREISNLKRKSKKIALSTYDPKVDMFKCVTLLEYYHNQIQSLVEKMQVINNLMHIFTAEEWNMIDFYLIKELHLNKCAELVGVSPRTFFRYMERIEKKYKEARNQNGGRV